MSEMEPCPQCGERNGSADLVCWACGSALAGPGGGTQAGAARAFTCPAGHGPLVRLTCQALVLDGCSQCAGVWLEWEEIAAARYLTADSLGAVEAKLGWSAAVPAGGMTATGARACPACESPMREQPYGRAQGLRVDSCPRCRGLWLDAGE